MKCLHLHIGSHKAGSTSLQQYFSQNVDYMREKYHLLYPVGLFPKYPSQHSELWRLVSERDEHSIRQCFKKLRDRTSDPEKLEVLLSGEDLSAMSRQQVAWFVPLVREYFDELRVYLILRDKKSYYLSQIKHQYVHDRKLDVFGFLDTLSFFPLRLIEAWRYAIGAGNINIVRYDDVKGNFQQEFCKILTRGDDVFPDPLQRYSNVSIDFMSAMIAEVILKSWTGYNAPDYVSLIRTVAARHPAVPFERLEESIGSAFQAHYADTDWPEELRFKGARGQRPPMNDSELKSVLAFYADLMKSCTSLIDG